MEKLLVLYVFCCLLALVVESLRHGDMDMCPRFTVKKNTIIRTKDSKARGAKMLAKQDVDSARECYLLCCERENCNSGIMRYTHTEDADSDRERVERKCYLFDCKEPNVCTFVNHTGYAVIELHRSKMEQPKQEEPMEKCPPGVPVAMCAGDPCEAKSCAKFPDATCKPSYCGGCKAVFYQGSEKIDCSLDTKDTGEIKNEPTKSDMTSTATTSKDTGVVNEEEVEVAPDDAGPAPTEDPDSAEAGEDPHAVKEWRHFLTDPSERRPDPTASSQQTASTSESFVDLHVEEPTTGPPKVYIKEVKYLETGATSIPLLIALIACIVVLVAVIWRLRCSGRGKHSKKFAVDDGDYLINGMYL